METSTIFSSNPLATMRYFCILLCCFALFGTACKKETPYPKRIEYVVRNNTADSVAIKFKTTYVDAVLFDSTIFMAGIKSGEKR